MSIQLSAIGGTPPYTWSSTTNPNNGLTLSSSGLITGTPIAAINTTWNITVTDSLSNTFSLALPFIVYDRRNTEPIIKPFYNSPAIIFESSFSPNFNDLPLLYTLDKSSKLIELPIQTTNDNSIHSYNIESGGGGS